MSGDQRFNRPKRRISTASAGRQVILFLCVLADPGYRDELRRAAFEMKIRSAEFETSAPTLAGCPPPGLPEFAFIGRSNVGKSSLVNLLTHQKGLAKVSATPGRTRLINFFRVNDAWRLVDLPGYGYAKVAREARAKFNAAIAEYITERESLRQVLVLVDSRLEPQQIDMEFVYWLAGREIPFVLIFTKIDKVKHRDLERNRGAFLAAMAAWCPFVPRTFTSSTMTRHGAAEVLRFISEETE